MELKKRFGNISIKRKLYIWLSLIVATNIFLFIQAAVISSVHPVVASEERAMVNAQTLMMRQLMLF